MEPESPEDEVSFYWRMIQEWAREQDTDDVSEVDDSSGSGKPLQAPCEES